MLYKNSFFFWNRARYKSTWGGLVYKSHGSFYNGHWSKICGPLRYLYFFRLWSKGIFVSLDIVFHKLIWIATLRFSKSWKYNFSVNNRSHEINKKLKLMKEEKLNHLYHYWSHHNNKFSNNFGKFWLHRVAQLWLCLFYWNSYLWCVDYYNV